MKLLVLLGTVISACFGSIYLVATIKGKVQPNRVTWLLWSLSPMSATIVAISTGISWSILPVFMAGFMLFLIFLGSFINKSAYWKISLLDLLCAALSIGTLVIWKMTNEPNLAVLFAILSDALAALPTYIKIWLFPYTERPFFYIGGTFSSLTSLIAAPNNKLTTIGFAVYLVVLNTSLMLLIYFRQKKFSSSN